MASLLVLLMTWGQIYGISNEPAYDKTSKMTCASSEDSEQTWHPPRLISLYYVYQRTKGFFMWIAKTDQTGWMPGLILVFAGRICNFVRFVVLRLKCNVTRGTHGQYTLMLPI